MKMLIGLEHLSCEDRLREPLLLSVLFGFFFVVVVVLHFCPEKSRFWGYLTAVFQYLRGTCKWKGN